MEGAKTPLMKGGQEMSGPDGSRRVGDSMTPADTHCCFDMFTGNIKITSQPGIARSGELKGPKSTWSSIAGARLTEEVVCPLRRFGLGEDNRIDEFSQIGVKEPSVVLQLLS